MTGGPIRPRRLTAAKSVMRFRRALAQLDDHYRMVLTLYYFDDMKYTDIAEVLGIPLNTVKSHIRRGKERLAAIMETQQQPPTARAVNAPPQRTQPPRPGAFLGLTSMRLGRA